MQVLLFRLEFDSRRIFNHGVIKSLLSEISVAQDLVRERKNQVKAAADGMLRGMPQPDVVARALTEAAAKKAEAEERSQQAAQRCCCR